MDESKFGQFEHNAQGKQMGRAKGGAEQKSRVAARWADRGSEKSSRTTTQTGIGASIHTDIIPSRYHLSRKT